MIATGAIIFPDEADGGFVVALGDRLLGPFRSPHEALDSARLARGAPVIGAPSPPRRTTDHK